MTPFSLFGVALCVVCFAAVSEQACPTSFNGMDLSGLTTTTEYTGTDSNNFVFHWNFCATPTEGNSGLCRSWAGASIVQIAQGGCTPLGYLDSQAITETSDGVQIYYINNKDSQCPGGYFRTTYHKIKCDSSTAYSLDSITEPSTCVYNINARSKYVCGGSKSGAGGLSGGWIFVIILLCSATAYLLVGAVVKWKVMGASPGVDLIPNLDFWSYFLSLVKDGVLFVKNGFSKTGSYSSL